MKPESTKDSTIQDGQLGDNENQVFISNNFRYRLEQNKQVNDSDDASIKSDNQSEQTSTEEGDAATPQFNEISDDVNVITANNEEIETTNQVTNESSDDSTNYDEVVNVNEEVYVENNDQGEVPDTVNSQHGLK